MNSGWTFKKAGPGDRARESQVEKFFNSDAVANRANAIVREGIQNSLDAAPDDAVVRVSITIGVWSEAEAAERLATYAKGLDEHLSVEAIQRKIIDIPKPREQFRYLVFEDFGTSGLLGNSSQWWPDEHGLPNPFFNYFRAEGISDKTDGSRGRHGVGRLVFMFASRVRSMFGLTYRGEKSEAEELLMGTSVLRNHWLNQNPYLPDGWYGMPDEAVAGLILPISDQKFIAKFKNDFSVSRQDQKGLTVVVPWLSEDVTVDEVTKAVLAGYFHPILRGKLVVDIIDEAGLKKVIDKVTIDAIAESQSAALVAQMKPIIAMAKASLAVESRITLPAPSGQNAPRWDSVGIPEEISQAIHDKLEAGELVALCASMQVRPKGSPVVDCRFDIFLQRDSSVADGQVQFIREGIIITDVRPRRTSGIRALVVIDDGPLATFLGDSENPSHTQWQKDLVKDKYVYAPAHIEYVVQSVPSILSIISGQQKKPDTSLLVDLFSIPADEETGQRIKQDKQREKSGDRTEPQVIDISRTQRRFIIDKRAGGFVVRKGDAGAEKPQFLSIKVAYGVRRGNPFSKYNPADFQLSDSMCKLSGSRLIGSGDNWLLVEINDNNFEIVVEGFDTDHRDLHIDVKVKVGEIQADQNAGEVTNAATP